MADAAGQAPPDHVYRGAGGIPRDARIVAIDPSVTVIRDWLFCNRNRLEIVTFHGGLLKIGQWAFAGCSSLRIFRCPPMVREIGGRALWGCSSLKEAELPQGLEMIEKETFAECTSLRKIRIPSTVTEIEEGAFCGCTDLSSAQLREGLRRIGPCTFAGCSSLGSICIPPSVVYVGAKAFKDCSNLDLVQLHEDLPKMEENFLVEGVAFSGCPAVRFRFPRLSERRGAIALDQRAISKVDGLLNGIAGILVGRSTPRNQQKTCKGRLRRAHKVLTDALREDTTALELALWKKKLCEEGLSGEGLLLQSGQQFGAGGGGRRGGRHKRDRNGNHVGEGGLRGQADGAGDGRINAGGQSPRPTRQKCRVQCGAGVVIRSVLEFIPSPWP